MAEYDIEFMKLNLVEEIYFYCSTNRHMARITIKSLFLTVNIPDRFEVVER